MPRTSAGLLMYRLRGGRPEVLLVHPGGPFWAGKDEGAWSIPKGEPDPGEDLLAAACREFKEETGFEAASPFIPLTPVQQKAGKMVHAWAFCGDCDPTARRSNTFQARWPPGTGEWRSFPEVDRAEFFSLDEASKRINPGQLPLLEELGRKLGS